MTGPRSRAQTAVLLMLVSVALWRIGVTVLDGPSHVFSEQRLLGVFLLLEGKAVYAPPAIGPFYEPMYTPLSFLFYLPVAVSRDPVTVLRLGSALTAFAVFVPCALLLWPRGRGPRELAGFVLAIACLVAWIHDSPVLRAALFVHADAPGLFFAGVGVWLLHRAIAGDSDRLLAAALVACSLAPWAKQTFAPVILLPVLALLASGARRRALAACFGTGLLQLFWVGLAGLAFGFRNLFFWTVEYPSLFAWTGPRVEVLSNANRVLLVEGLPLAAVCVFGCFAAARDGRFAEAMGRSLWGLLFVTALLLWPLSLLGFVKAGAAANTLVPALYFLTTAGVAYLLEVSREPEDAALTAVAAGRTLAVLAVLLSLQSAVESGVAMKRIAGTIWGSRVAERTVRQNPDTFFFPWYPLSTYLATGQFLNSDLALLDRRIAKIPIAESEILAHVPRNVKFVVCGLPPCESTLASFEVVRSRQGPPESGSWTIHEVRPRSSAPPAP